MSVTATGIYKVSMALKHGQTTKAAQIFNLATASSESIFASFTLLRRISGTSVCVSVCRGRERASDRQLVQSLDRRKRTLPTDIGD